MKQRWLLLVILGLAACLRLVGIGKWPGSLYWEEAALGYDAYSIWETGKDYHGNPWPLVAFESFGDYKPSGYFYVAAPFVGIFGLNNWSIRLPSALSGIATVYLVYLVAQLLFKRKNIALWSAAVLAIMPWHIQFSRAAFEVNVATMWMMLGIYLLLKAVKQTSLLLPATISFVLAAYTYHGLRIAGPLIALTLLIFNFRKMIVSKWFWLSGLTAVFLMLPLLINLTNPVVNQRFNETSLFSTSQAVAVTNQLREADGNTLLSRLIHHRYLYWGKEILNGISDHFSINFLFLTGDGNLRHQTGYVALLYLWQIIPLALTFIYFSKKQKRSFLILLLWLIWAALPAALTNLTPHTLRFFPAAPAFAILTGYGLDMLLRQKKVYLSILVLMIIGSSLFAYAFDYITSYQNRSAFEWQVGYKELVEYIGSVKGNYQYIQVTRAYGRPSIYFLYYLATDPRIIQTVDLSLEKDQGELLEFDAFHFGPIDPTISGLVASDVTLSYGKLLNTITATSGIPIFYIYEL